MSFIIARRLAMPAARAAARLEERGCRVVREIGGAWRVETPPWEARLLEAGGQPFGGSAALADVIRLEDDGRGGARWRLRYGTPAQLAVHALVAAIFAAGAWLEPAWGLRRAAAFAAGFVAAQLVPCALAAWGAARLFESLGESLET